MGPRLHCTSTITGLAGGAVVSDEQAVNFILSHAKETNGMTYKQSAGASAALCRHRSGIVEQRHRRGRCLHAIQAST